MDCADSEAVVSSSSSGVTVLQYLLQNESTGSVGTTDGAGSSVKIYPCTLPGCKKHYLNEDHLKAHEKYHGGDDLSVHRKQPENEEISNEFKSAREQDNQSGLRFLLQNGHLELVEEEQDEPDALAEEELEEASRAEQNYNEQQDADIISESLIEYDEEVIENETIVLYSMNGSSSELDDSIIQYVGEEEAELEASLVQELDCDTDYEEDESTSLKETKQLTYSAKYPVPEPDPKRTFRCSFDGCCKSYTRKSHLKAHELLHTGILPFHCPWENCGAAFARSYELSRHRRMHSGERKFVCHICQQAFIRSDHLSSHVKRHTFRAGRIKPA
uniref:C2H2-type domain-containing protein n=1 Tax=Anopheles dirus TaxID=7168 RepID=A0A182MY28_9DIPT